MNVKTLTLPLAVSLFALSGVQSEEGNKEYHLMQWDGVSSPMKVFFKTYDKASTMVPDRVTACIEWRASSEEAQQNMLELKFKIDDHSETLKKHHLAYLDAQLLMENYEKGPYTSAPEDKNIVRKMNSLISDFNRKVEIYNKHISHQTDYVRAHRDISKDKLRIDSKLSQNCTGAWYYKDDYAAALKEFNSKK